MRVTGYKKLGTSRTEWECAEEDGMKEFLYENGLLSAVLNADCLQIYINGVLEIIIINNSRFISRSVIQNFL